MIRNQYIYELSIPLDFEHLTNIIKNFILTKREKSSHHYEAEKDLYLLSIKQTYPFLSSIFNIYRLHPKQTIPLHVDAKRKTALNIPIQGCDDSLTIFHKFVSHKILEYNEKYIYYTIHSETEKTFEFTLKKPTIINNTIPHEVINGTQSRIIISWSILPEYSFEDIIQLIDNHN